MYTCINCNEEKETILSLSCEHQICLKCLIKSSTFKCLICNKKYEAIPKEIINIIDVTPKYSCPYHSNDIECDASCFL